MYVHKLKDCAFVTIGRVRRAIVKKFHMYMKVAFLHIYYQKCVFLA